MRLTKQLVLATGAGLLFFGTMLTVSSCKKSSTTPKTPTPVAYDSLAHLVAYKNSVHPIFVGYLVGDGNDPVPSYNPATAPDSVDYLEFFAGRDANVADWRAAQAKGTKIVPCHFISDAYFDGSAKDPATQAPGYVNPSGFDQSHSTATSTYYHWARDTYNNEIVSQKLDGLDLDIESGTFGGDVQRTAANGDSLVVAIARYYGPKCTQCSVMNSAGQKPVFFYDTDGSSGLESTMYTPNKDNYSYVLFQSYTTGAHYWSGAGIASFGPLVTTYGADKLVFLVNGDSFIYPDGTQDQPHGDSIATANLYSYATWVKQNNAAGVGAYRMSRDYNHTPSFAVSKHAIQLMNPAQ